MPLILSIDFHFRLERNTPRVSMLARHHAKNIKLLSCVRLFVQHKQVLYQTGQI